MEKQVKVMDVIKDFTIITIGIIVVAFAAYFFLIPSCLSVGSVSGLSIVINELVHIPISVITFVINVIFLILGFLFIGKEFGGKTVYTSILFPIIIGVFERLFPNFQSMMGDQFLDMLCYCIVVSVGMAILFLRNASSGGLDIAAKILNKFFRLELGKAMALSGMVVALSSGLVYDAKTVVLSIMGTYLNGVILDNILFGMNSKKRVCILSEKSKEIRDYVINDLHSGATLYNVIGGFNFEPHSELTVIVDKSEYSKLINFVSQIDKDAFITVYTVNEIMYKPKKNIEKVINK